MVLLFFSVSYANAQVSVYFHPLSLFSIIFNTTVTAIYSTIEIPNDSSSSIIVKPCFLKEETDLDLLKFGSDIGMRHYLFEKGKGLYFQEQIGIFYYRNRDVSDSDMYVAILEFHPSNVKGFSLDAMGYLGYSSKLAGVSVFADVGLGVSTTEKSIIDPKRLRLYLLPDFNFGIGFSI